MGMEGEAGAARTARAAVVALVAVLGAGWPAAGAAGQEEDVEAELALPDVRASQVPVDVRAARMASEVEDLVRRALAGEKDRRRPLAERADSLARILVAVQPASADAHHWRAVTAGVLADVAGVREKIDLGRAAYDSARRAVELDPAHPGAHHVMGRIHAGVLRLGWFSRFVAGKMGLDEVLDGATWEDAERHLARAVELKPDEPAYRIELATLLLERGRRSEATAHLRRVLERPVEEPLDERHRDRARELLDGG